MAVTEVSAGEVGIFEVGAIEFTANEAGLEHGGVLKVGLSEVGLDEHEPVEVGGASAVGGSPGVPGGGALLQGE